MHDAGRLSLLHLTHLEALVIERHVTRAAERVGIGQPAMSTTLAKLRKILKDPLLVKTSSGMEPTPRAVELARRAREMVDLLEGRSGTLSEFDLATSTGKFRIMASDGIARLIVPALMHTVEKEAPNMRFTVNPGDVRRTAEYLRDGDFDMVLAFVRKPHQELHQSILYPQQLMCIARAGHPVIDGHVSLKQFTSLPHAVWGAPPVPYPTMEVMVEEALSDLGLSRRVSLHVSSVMMLTEVVAKTDLLAVVPARLALAAGNSSALQVLKLPFRLPSVDVSMVWHERVHNDQAHKWLRDTLRDIGRAMQ